MQHRRDSRLAHEFVGDVFEHLGVESVADRLRLGQRGAHGLGALFEFDADALAVDRAFVPVPGEALDADLRDVAAEAAVAFQQHHACAGTRRSQRGSESRGAAADDQDVGFCDDDDAATRFGDLAHGRHSSRISSAPIHRSAA